MQAVGVRVAQEEAQLPRGDRAVVAVDRHRQVTLRPQEHLAVRRQELDRPARRPPAHAGLRQPQPGPEAEAVGAA